MTIEEYEARFRYGPSLHQRFRELRGVAHISWVRRPLWLAGAAACLALAGLELVADQALYRPMPAVAARPASGLP